MKNRGFTLLETVIALVILQVGILGMLGLFGAVFQANKYCQDYTTAVSLAEDKIETLRAGGANEFVALKCLYYEDLNNPIIPHEGAGGRGFWRTWTISSYPDKGGVCTDTTKMKAVSVTVLWNKGRGDNKITLDGVIARTQ